MNRRQVDPCRLRTTLANQLAPSLEALPLLSRSTSPCRSRAGFIGSSSASLSLDLVLSIESLLHWKLFHFSPARPRLVDREPSSLEALPLFSRSTSSCRSRAFFIGSSSASLSLDFVLSIKSLFHRKLLRLFLFQLRFVDRESSSHSMTFKWATNLVQRTSRHRSTHYL